MNSTYELIDNAEYRNHQQVWKWLAAHYQGPISIATGYLNLDGLDALAQFVAG